MNNKGLTIIEMLITLSVSSIVLMMLMGLTSNIILTRNVVEYTNRIDSEMFDLTETIRSRLGDTTYSSIHYYETDDFEINGDVILITREFEPVIEDGGEKLSLSRDNFRVDILFLDVTRETLYFDTLYLHNPESNIDIQDYIEGDLTDDSDTLANDVFEFISDPEAYNETFIAQAISQRVKILEGSRLTLDNEADACERILDNIPDEETNIGYITDEFDIDGFVSLCLSNYLIFDLNITYELNSGNLMPERSYETTIFIP